jgi:hypothetical protein
MFVLCVIYEVIGLSSWSDFERYPLKAGQTSTFTSTSPRMHSTLRTSHFFRSDRSVTSPVCLLRMTRA